MSDCEPPSGVVGTLTCVTLGVKCLVDNYIHPTRQRELRVTGRYRARDLEEIVREDSGLTLTADHVVHTDRPTGKRVVRDE